MCFFCTQHHAFEWTPSATEGGVRVEGQEPAHCLGNGATGYSFTQNSFLLMLRQDGKMGKEILFFTKKKKKGKNQFPKPGLPEAGGCLSGSDVYYSGF